MEKNIPLANTTKKFSDNFPLEEFFKRYVNYHEEFAFFYKDYKIELKHIDGYNAVVVSADGKLKQFHFHTTFQAFNSFRIDGKSICEIWDDLQ